MIGPFGKYFMCRALSDLFAKSSSNEADQMNDTQGSILPRRGYLSFLSVFLLLLYLLFWFLFILIVLYYILKYLYPPFSFSLSLLSSRFAGAEKICDLGI